MNISLFAIFVLTIELVYMEGEAPKSLQARYCFRWKNFKAVAVHGETDHHNAVSLCS